MDAGEPILRGLNILGGNFTAGFPTEIRCVGIAPAGHICHRRLFDPHPGTPFMTAVMLPPQSEFTGSMTAFGLISKMSEETSPPHHQHW